MHPVHSFSLLRTVLVGVFGACAVSSRSVTFAAVTSIRLPGEVQGVFASRAPRRPNPIGLSLVRNRGINGNVIDFAGVDLLDGTPVLDIKPWFADADQPPD